MKTPSLSALFWSSPGTLTLKAIIGAWAVLAKAISRSVTSPVADEITRTFWGRFSTMASRVPATSALMITLNLFLAVSLFLIMSARVAGVWVCADEDVAVIS